MAGVIEQLESQKQHHNRLKNFWLEQAEKRGKNKDRTTPKAIISKAAKEMYPELSQTQVSKATREITLAPQRSNINVGNETLSVSEARYKIAEHIEKSQAISTIQKHQQRIIEEAKKKAPNTDVKTEDLAYIVATSIETLNSETNSSQEYFSWFEDCTSILKNMNDGYISDSDLQERQEWLDYSYVREAEMMTCLALYQSSRYPGAKEKYDQIYNKLVKIRQIRHAIKDATASKSDETKERIDKSVKMFEHQRARVYVAAFREFLKQDEKWNMPKKTLRRLNMYRGDDYDLEGEYDFFYGPYEVDDYDEQYQFYDDYERNPYDFDGWMQESVLFGWDDDVRAAPVYSKAEEFVDKGYEAPTQTEDDVRARIAELSGRRPPYRDNGLGPREYRARSFDADKFKTLYKSNGKQNS